MKLNCKAGDLAVQVRSHSGNEGRIFTCLRLASLGELEAEGFETRMGAVWLIDTQIAVSNGYLIIKRLPLALDKWLRPIHDNPGQDESLQWLDVPSTDKVTA